MTSDSSDDDLEDVPGLGDEAAASLGNRKIPPPRFVFYALLMSPHAKQLPRPSNRFVPSTFASVPGGVFVYAAAAHRKHASAFALLLTRRYEYKIRSGMI